MLTAVIAALDARRGSFPMNDNPLPRQAIDDRSDQETPEAIPARPLEPGTVPAGVRTGTARLEQLPQCKASESGCKTADERRGLLCASIDQLEKLKDGWDSYSAPAPQSAAIENAKSLVAEAEQLDVEPERIEPSAMGGVGVTFSAAGREVVIEFYNKGTAHALFSEDSTGDMSTRPVQTNQNGYRVIIDEVQKYLYGK
jgi:hypothetical protein